MPIILKIMGGALADRQYTQIDAAERREFGLPLPEKSHLGDRLYFLLMEPERDDLLACGYLKPISQVLFGNETFSFLNVGGIIANEKGKGYGKQIMRTILAYLTVHDQTGLGFCFEKNRVFYEKCGFIVDSALTRRFIYRQGNERITAEPQCVLYRESSRPFISKVLADASQEVYVPDPSIW